MSIRIPKYSILFFLLITVFLANGQQIINPEEADTIASNPFFIITMKDSVYTIYNPNLEKININNIKSVYLKPNGLEVLNDEGAHYYDKDGNKVNKLAPVPYLVCGTVTSTHYKIVKGGEASRNKTYSIHLTEGGMAAFYQKKIEFWLAGVDKKHDLRFLDDSDSYYSDANDSYIGRKPGFPQLLKVKKGKKFGIVEYEHYSYLDLYTVKDTLSDIPFDEIRYFPEIVEVKEILPVVYDSITFNKNNGLVYFYKNKMAGIYPRHTTLQYKDFKEITESFYSFSKKGRQGWLDIHTNWEYYFEEP